MGVEHYLVDNIGKNVLSCGKWYELEAHSVTVDNVPDGWRAPAVKRWLREVALGRPVRLVTDCGVGDTSEFEDDLCRPLPGCTGYSLYIAEAGWTYYEAESLPCAEQVFGASGHLADDALHATLPPDPTRRPT